MSSFISFLNTLHRPIKSENINLTVAQNPDGLSSAPATIPIATATKYIFILPPTF
jgi:hypothetical protein